MLSACHTPSHSVHKSFCILESEDGSFCSMASNNDDYFYSYLEINGEKKLVFCDCSVSQGYPVFCNLNVSVQPTICIDFETKCFLDNTKYEFKSTFNNFSGDPKYDNWTQIVHLREASELELDAKYYVKKSYKGLNDQLKLIFKEEMRGYLDDNEYFNTHHVHLHNYVYFGNSSIFTFKLFGQYNGQSFIFRFLDNQEFAIFVEEEIKAKGTYSSNGVGMTLSFIENNFFDIKDNDLKLESYYDSEGKDESTYDLSSYIDNDAIFINDNDYQKYHLK